MSWEDTAVREAVSPLENTYLHAPVTVLRQGREPEPLKAGEF